MSQPNYVTVKAELKRNPRSWLITGAAGFIGSNLTKALLALNQRVVAIDNLSTGKRQNLVDIQGELTPEQWKGLKFEEIDVRDTPRCSALAGEVDFILHQAALGSVPRSIEDPLRSNDNNVSGMLSMLLASHLCSSKRLVFASSSSVYGDNERSPKVEDEIGTPQSPYAITKRAGEMYAKVFALLGKSTSVGLRYFNVYGPRQDPSGPYSAVIPRWIDTIMKGEQCRVNGDGSTSRDFTFVEDVVQANILAAYQKQDVPHQIFNIAVGQSTGLRQLHGLLRKYLSAHSKIHPIDDPIFGDFRLGDIRNSLADISLAKTMLGYAPQFKIEEGLKVTVDWYAKGYKK